MSKVTRTTLGIAIMGLLFAAVSVPAFAQQDLKSDMRSTTEPAESQIQLRNESKWSIQQLFFAPVNSNHWGPDQLNRHSVRMGDSFTLTGISCDKYDVKLVDEDGDECVVKSLALCSTSKIWTLTDNDLLKCQSHTPQ